MNEPRVHLYKTILMQRLLDSVAQGYHYFTAGQIPATKARRLAEKFAERYGTDRNANQRAYARRMGRANARLILYGPPGQRVLSWWLLATPGEGPVHAQERLQDAHDRHQRIRLDDDYELTRYNNPHTGKPTWTWRMTRACIRRWHERLHQAATEHPGDQLMRQALYSLAHAPGFAGIRHQVGQLYGVARSQWGRHRRDNAPMPAMERPGYVERLKDRTVSLSEWVADALAFETDDPVA